MAPQSKSDTGSNKDSDSDSDEDTLKSLKSMSQKITPMKSKPENQKNDSSGGSDEVDDQMLMV